MNKRKRIRIKTKEKGKGKGKGEEKSFADNHKIYRFSDHQKIGGIKTKSYLYRQGKDEMYVRILLVRVRRGEEGNKKARGKMKKRGGNKTCTAVKRKLD